MGDNLDLYSLNLASSCLSLFGSAAIILNYICFANKSQALYKLILFLSVADFGGSLSICISQVLLFLHHYGDTPYGPDICQTFRAFINLFFLSSFFWTSAIALHIWVSSLQKAQIPLYWFHIVCWGVPGLSTIILVSAKMITVEGDGLWCSNTPLGHWLFWYGPLIICFVWNATFYALILRHYRYAGQRDGRGKMKEKVKKRVTFYMLAFFTCWIWSMLNFIWGLIAPTPIWLQLLSTAFLPLQGFLNFLVYGISSRMFRHRQTPKSPTHQMAINYNDNESQKLLKSNNAMYS